MTPPKECQHFGMISSVARLFFAYVHRNINTSDITISKSIGARTANGLSMLLHQGAISFETWFNQEAPIDAMKKGLDEAIQK